MRRGRIDVLPDPVEPPLPVESVLEVPEVLVEDELPDPVPVVPD